jgi:hypothetical protein
MPSASKHLNLRECLGHSKLVRQVFYYMTATNMRHDHEDDITVHESAEGGNSAVIREV